MEFEMSKPKQGVLHDYDLMANNESSAQNKKCVVCSAVPMTFQWSDYHGEGMCTQCGTPYQLKGGSDQQKKENKYPYLNLRKEIIPLVQDYFFATGKFTYLGTGFSRPGIEEFYKWLEENKADELKGLLQDEH